MEYTHTTSSITNREKQVLKLIAGEHTTLEISAILRISSRTVETHRKNILRKINSKSLVGLTKLAIKLGLLEEFIYKPAIQNKSIIKSLQVKPE